MRGDEFGQGAAFADLHALQAVADDARCSVRINHRRTAGVAGIAPERKDGIGRARLGALVAAKTGIEERGFVDRSRRSKSIRFAMRGVHILHDIRDRLYKPCHRLAEETASIRFWSRFSRHSAVSATKSPRSLVVRSFADVGIPGEGRARHLGTDDASHSSRGASSYGEVAGQAKAWPGKRGPWQTGLLSRHPDRKRKVGLPQTSRSA